MLRYLLTGGLLMTLLAGCTAIAPQPKKHSDLLPDHGGVKLILIDEAYFIDLKNSDEEAFHSAAAKLKTGEMLSDNFDKFLSQLIARVPLYGDRWRDTYDYTLVFYVQGHEQLDPLRGYQVNNSAGETISQGFQLIPGDHLLELSISQNKYEIDGDLQISLTVKDGGLLQFIVPQTALPTPVG